MWATVNVEASGALFIRRPQLWSHPGLTWALFQLRGVWVGVVFDSLVKDGRRVLFEDCIVAPTEGLMSYACPLGCEQQLLGLGVP